jgi:hypothetical protein
MKDAKGVTLAPEKLLKWKRLRRFDFRTKSDDNKMRNLSQAITEIERYSDLLHLPKYARGKAISLYRSALQRDLLRGRTISDFAAAAIYATCRQLRVPRSLSEVSKASGRSLRDVSRTYRLLVREFDLKMPVDDARAQPMAVSSESSSTYMALLPRVPELSLRDYKNISKPGLSITALDELLDHGEELPLDDSLRRAQLVCDFTAVHSDESKSAYAFDPVNLQS